MAELAELTELFQQASNKDTIHLALRRHIRSAKSVTRRLFIIGNDRHYLQTRSFPSTKLHEKQKWFFSTKKKTKLERPRVTLSETTRQELKDIELHCFCLLPQGRSTKFHGCAGASGLDRVWKVPCVGSYCVWLCRRLYWLHLLYVSCLNTLQYWLWLPNYGAAKPLKYLYSSFPLIHCLWLTSQRSCRWSIYLPRAMITKSTKWFFFLYSLLYSIIFVTGKLALCDLELRILELHCSK